MPPAGDVIYRLNDRDEICFANEAYDQFAAANDGMSCASGAVLHHPLWGFITDRTTRQLYRDILGRVRRGRPVRFPFRCDSPACRRLMEMDIGGAGGTVEFRVRTIAEDSRPFQALLAAEAPRSRELLRACSWCKKVHVGDAWAEVEDAVARLRLFERPVLPAVTHGICEPCYQQVFGALADP